jgi:hypothetical protein
MIGLLNYVGEIADARLTSHMSKSEAENQRLSEKK